MASWIGVGDIQVYVSDFERALRFWSEGLGLPVADKEIEDGGGFARLEFPQGGPSLNLVGPVDAWDEEDYPAPGSRPSVVFDVLATDFDATLARLVACGGVQDGSVENFNGLRVVTVIDPDGNAFDLVEIKEEDAPE